MEQYISKSTLVAEIKKLSAYLDSFHEQRIMEKILFIIDTLDVKEVDLEKETKKWWKEHLHLNPENKLWMDAHQSVELAKHFYELGLKAQKGE